MFYVGDKVLKGIVNAEMSFIRIGVNAILYNKQIPNLSTWIKLSGIKNMSYQSSKIRTEIVEFRTTLRKLGKWWYYKRYIWLIILLPLIGYWLLYKQSRFVSKLDNLAYTKAAKYSYRIIWRTYMCVRTVYSYHVQLTLRYNIQVCKHHSTSHVCHYIQRIPSR